MGFTQYLENKPAFTDSQWATFTNAVKKLFRQTKIPLAGPDGKGEPVVNASVVSFNGVDDGVNDNSHETCYISKAAQDYEFCKTAEKPYDAVVVAVYKLVREILPTTVLSSDGGEAVFSKPTKAPKKAPKQTELPIKEANSLTKCFEIKGLEFPIKLEQRANKKFRVTYGQEVSDNLDYGTAAEKLGDAIMHALAIAGKLDNSGED